MTWKTNWDQDDQNLNYSVYRSDKTAPIYTTTATSQFWNRPSLTFTDTGLTPGTSYTYSVAVSDPSGNTVRSASATVTTTGTKPPQTGTVATDTFTRTTAAGWGAADSGGAWTVSPASAFSTSAGRGTMALSGPGASTLATLGTVYANNVTTTLDVSTNTAGTGNGSYLILRSRVVGSSAYLVKLRFLPGGVVHLAASKVVAGVETVLKEVAVTGLTYTPGATLRLRVGVQTVGTQTTLTGTVWPSTQTTAPTAPQLSAVDALLPLPAGAVGLQGYVSGNSAAGASTISVDNLGVQAS